jgi:anti-sigma factor RsiW
VVDRKQRAGARAHAPGARRERVAFLFFGELFLIPHLLPIAVALSRQEDAPEITLFVITSAHEEIIAEALDGLGITTIRIRRAHGFRRLPAGTRETPHLPWKPRILTRNAPAIMGNDVVVVAERTSLWMPRIARGKGPAFIYNEHGAGPHANFASPRNRAASRIMMPGDGMAERFRACGNEDVAVSVVGYIKRDFIREISGSGRLPLFPEDRPTVVYVPHWLRPKSSWWDMGEQVLDYFAASDRYNLIVAPHIRLPEFVPDFEARVARFRDCPNIHIDATSFRLIDQSYINNADIYLGDGSSQVLEFAERPRPVLFLNPQGHDWANDPRFSHWAMGEVVRDIAGMDAALAGAADRHPAFEPVQRAYVARMMGTEEGHASTKAAQVVREVAAERREKRAGSGQSDAGTVVRLPARRGPWPSASAWRRAAAILVIAGSGWLARDLVGAFTQPAYAASFVDEASASYTASMARERMVSQPETTALNRSEILQTTGLALPGIPAGWRLTDVQVYPAEAAMAISIVMRTDRGEVVSLFAARADTPATGRPLVENRQGRSIAYWEAGPVAYALTGELGSKRLLELADRVRRRDAVAPMS